MEKPHRNNPEDRRGQPSDDPADPDLAAFGEQADDFIARAITDALAEGMSWAQIGARLGVPSPAPDHDDEVSDRDWQEAIVAHENARAARRRYDRHRTTPTASTRTNTATRKPSNGPKAISPNPTPSSSSK